MINLSVVLCVLCIIKFTISANIFGFIYVPSISHQIPFRPIWRELSLRGHKVTVVTADPMNDHSLTNLTEIDVHFLYDILESYDISKLLTDESNSVFDIARTLIKMIREMSEEILKMPGIKKLMNDENTHFDVMLAEPYLPFILGLVYKFNCPWIGVTSLDAPLNVHESVGNPTHPILNPDYNLLVDDVDNLTFKERMMSFLYNLSYKFFLWYHFSREHQRLKPHFGEDLPSLFELQNNMSMLFVNTNPIFHNIRPTTPSTISFGTGIHILPPKPLPQDIEKYLDDAKEGVIYFSLGSNVKGGFLNESTRNEIMKGFADVPYKILAKLDGKVNNIPKNVMVKEWLPQQDILRHPNVKLFVTQGGLQSLQEAITNHIPLVSIPFFGDQFQNVQKMVKKGVGVKIHYEHITKQSLKSAITEVMGNNKYRENAKKMGDILVDQPMTSLDETVWWIEYVIRHRGAHHLKSHSVDLPFYKYYMLDVFSFVLSIIIVSLYFCLKVLQYVYRLLLGRKIKKKIE